jgi:hypothetical protein
MNPWAEIPADERPKFTPYEREIWRKIERDLLIGRILHRTKWTLIWTSILGIVVLWAYAAYAETVTTWRCPGFDYECGPSGAAGCEVRCPHGGLPYDVDFGVEREQEK